MRALKITASIVFNLVFVSNTILLRFFLFFLMIDLYFLIPVVTAQIFNPASELVIPTGIPTYEAKAEIKKHRLTGETKIRNCSNLKSFPLSLFHLSNHVLFLLKDFMICLFFSLKSSLTFSFAIFVLIVLIYYLVIFYSH